MQICDSSLSLCMSWQRRSLYKLFSRHNFLASDCIQDDCPVRKRVLG